MADDGYDEFLSILAAAPSKDDVKKAETSFKARRASLAKHVTNNAEKQTARPKVDRILSLSAVVDCIFNFTDVVIYYICDSVNWTVIDGGDMFEGEHVKTRMQ